MIDKQMVSSLYIHYKILLQLIQNQLNMQNWYNVQTFQENKPIRFDDPNSQRSCYFEIQSKNFIFKQFDKGTQDQRQINDINPQIMKYYSKRKFLFSKYQEGILMDTQSWFSVIPEKVSLYLRNRFVNDGYQTIFQPFCGVGGVAVHLCDSFKEYIVNDLDRNKLKMLKNNLQVYGKDPDLYKGYCEDFLKVEPYDASMLIVCPPWGGVNISAYSYQDLDNLMKPSLTSILTHCLKFSQNLVLQMPKNTNIQNLIKIVNNCKVNPVFTIEKILTNGRISQLLIYFGDHKFTHISTSSFYQQIYNDLQLTDRADKIKARQSFRQNPLFFMKEIYQKHHGKGQKINNQTKTHEKQHLF